MVVKKIEPRREARIINEIIVDAHTDDERAMSWYYYLEGELRFPFEAECIKQWPISPLRKGEKIRVTALASTKHCVHQIVVRGRWGGRSLGVPLAQLKLVGADKATAQAIADWHYWVARKRLLTGHQDPLRSQRGVLRALTSIASDDRDIGDSG